MAKRRTKKQRDAAERKRKQRRDSKRSEEMTRVLRMLGVLSEFRKQPMGLRNRLSRLRYPRPEIVFDSADEIEPEASEIVNDLSETLEEEWIAIEDSGGLIKLLEFFRIGMPLWHYFGLIKPAATGIKQADHFFASMHTATNDHIANNLDYALGIATSVVEYALLKYSRIDGTLYWISLHFPPEEEPDPKYLFRLTVHGHQAEERRREIDGVPKRLYRCGAGYGVSLEKRLHRCGAEYGFSLDWVSWMPADLGIEGPDKALPVFIDGGHALRNLRDRVTIAQDNGLVEDSIGASLRSPEVTWIEEKKRFLVSYQLHDHRLGYFVFTALDDMYVAKTFLFLTMDGTPEGDKLWNRLRLTKKDKQYTGLDRLSTFVLSDIKDDPELVAVFEQCGCAHLFDLAEDELTERQLRSTAADVRNYLGKQLERALTQIRPRTTDARFT